MSTRSMVCGLAALAVTGLMAFSASAAAISVNFIGGKTTLLSATDAAGVVPVANWNNVSGSNSGGAAIPFATLKDDSGTNVAGTGGGHYSNAEWAISTDPVDTPDKKLFKGYVDCISDTPTSVTVTGIPYDKYDVYVYFDGDNGAETRDAYYTVNGGTPALYTDAANAQFNGTFVDAAINGTGNYFKVSDLSGNFSLTAALGITGGVKRAPVNGFQIIAVPEPASLGLLGLSSLVMLRRRRPV